MDVLEVELVFRGIVRWIRRKKGASDGLCALRSGSALLCSTCGLGSQKRKLRLGAGGSSW